MKRAHRTHRFARPGALIPRRCARVALVAVVSLGALAGARAATAQAPSHSRSPSPEDSAQAIHLLNRATFGARPADIAAVLSEGRIAWLERQLQPDRIQDTAVTAIERRYPYTSVTPQELYRVLEPADGSKGPSPQTVLIQLASARLVRSAASERQLEQMMTDFWFNHFNVFFQKGADRYLVADYERSAIRPHVFGRFEDMLRATARHPAMLFYLDNWRSVHVDSGARRPLAQAQPKRMAAGLNENYARELMELHTLGVDGGYTQRDVVDVARAFTGWSFGPLNAKARSDDAGEFVFRAQLHDRGAKEVLGKELASGRGMEDGDDVLRLLAAHPATAHHIATKLVEYFVSDTPDPALADRLAAVFTKTGGDLRLVTRALFTDSAFYRAEHRRNKVKTPFHLVASTLRMTDAQFVDGRGAMQVLRAMGHVPYMSSDPTGYPATSEDWVNSGAMLARMNYGIDLASGKIAGIRPRSPESREAASATANLDGLTRALLPGVNTDALKRAVIADASSSANVALAPRQRAARAVGLVIGSPEFQRH